MPLNLNDLFSDDDDDFLLDENEEALDEADKQPLAGFHYEKSINSETYSPFLTSRKEYKLVHHSDAVDFLNDKTEKNKGWYHWSECGPGIIFTREFKDESSTKLVPLPPGVYTHEPATNSLPERLATYNLGREDHILELGDAFADVKGYVANFLAKKAVYEEVKTPYKLGLLLYGPPGNGKSILISRLIAEQKNAIVIYMDASAPVPSRLFLSKLDALTKDTLKIFIFEELTTNLNTRYVSWLLSFLDGEASISNSINIALTNYPEALPENIVNRPSRFDKLVEFHNPKPAERKKVFAHFMGREATEEEITKTDGFSIAGIKELCMSVRINDLTPLDAIAKLKERAAKCKKNFQKSQDRLGF